MSPSNGAMFRSKSRFATASTTSSDIATSNNRSEPTCHGFRFRSNGTSVTQHKSGINSMANATPVESRPKKRPMNSKPNKPTTPIPMIADELWFAGALLDQLGSEGRRHNSRSHWERRHAPFEVTSHHHRQSGALDRQSESQWN